MTQTVTAPDPAAQPRPASRRRRRHPVARMVSVSAGWVLLVVGIIITPTPVPIGLMLVAVAVFLLARDSHLARRGIRALRRRYPAVDRSLTQVSPRLPRTMRTVLRRTAPLASRLAARAAALGQVDRGAA